MISTRWIKDGEPIEDAHYIRRKVFIEEQNVSENDELDGTDSGALHLVAYESGCPVATGRLIVSGSDYYIGRIAVLKEHRNKNYGSLIMRMLIRKAYDMGGTKQYVHSQLSAEGFYKKLGFTPYGEVYLDAGIPHINMVREGDITGCC